MRKILKLLPVLVDVFPIVLDIIDKIKTALQEEKYNPDDRPQAGSESELFPKEKPMDKNINF
jgi:hypothetical protein